MNKKNVMRMMAAAALAFSLAACGDTAAPAEPVQTEATPTPAETSDTPDTAAPTEAETDKPAEGGDTAEVSPQSIYDEIAAACALPEGMYIANDDWVLNKYGLDASDMAAYVCAEGDETHVDRVFIVKLADGADAEAVKNKMGSELAQLATEEMSDYMEKAIPGQAKLIADASVKTKGDYIYLFISADAAKMEEILNNAVK